MATITGMQSSNTAPQTNGQPNPVIDQQKGDGVAGSTEAPSLNPESLVEPTFVGLEVGSHSEKLIAEASAHTTAKLLESVETDVDVPTADNWRMPKAMYYTQIVTPLEAPEGTDILMIPVDVWKNARLTLLSKMWTYARYSATVKLDMRLPLGVQLRFKVILVPDATTKPTYEQILAFPGYEWDPSEDPTLQLVADWHLADYLKPVGEIINQIAIVSLGENYSVSKTKVPHYITPSIVPRDVLFSVRKVVDISDGPTPTPGDLDPVNAVGVLAERILQPGTKGRASVWTWIYRIVGVAVAPLVNLIWPGSGTIVETAVDFIWNLFKLDKRTRALKLMEVPVLKGTPVEVKQMDEYMGVKVGNDEYVLASGDPLEPAPVMWKPPSEGFFEKTLATAVARAGGPDFMVNTAANGMMTVSKVPNSSGLDKYTFIDNKPDYEFQLNLRYGVYATGQAWEFPMHDAPTTEDGQSSFLLQRRLKLNGASRTVGCVLGYFPKGWKVGDPPQSLLTPYCDFGGADKDVVVRGFFLEYESVSQDRNLIPCVGVDFVKLSEIPQTPSVEGAPYAFLAPIYIDDVGGVHPVSYLSKSNSTNPQEQTNVFLCDVDRLTKDKTMLELPPYVGAVKMWHDNSDKVHDQVHFEGGFQNYFEATPAPATPVGLRSTFKTFMSKPKAAPSLIRTALKNATLVKQKFYNPSDMKYHVMEEGEEEYNNLVTDGGEYSPTQVNIECERGSFQGPSLPGTTGKINPDTSGLGGPVGYTPNQPLGHVSTHVTADNIWSPCLINFKIQKDTKVGLPINPAYANRSGNIQPSHLQVEALRHLWVGPNREKKLFKYRLTSVTNAYVNGRLLMIHVPYPYTWAQVEKMTLDELSQFPRVEHEAKGGDTIFEPQWTRPLPVMTTTNNTENNGMFVFAWVDYSNTDDNAEPAFSLWVVPNGAEYSVITPHRTYTATPAVLGV